jgi:2-polyprenyl-3-methyl-5-hydroxy-6-metoxy-1,4-benzoquinol methylase
MNLKQTSVKATAVTMPAVRDYVRALILLHRTFRALPFGARLHALIRFLTCPFLRLTRRVPAGARVLDVGAGHGVFAALLLDAGARSVVAVEPDLRKVLDLAAGRQGEAQLQPASFVAGYDSAIRGSFDVVSMIDVLYAIDKAQWDPLLARLAERVRPGGMLLLKEMDPASFKNRWNRLQEWITIHLLRLTLAEAIEFDSRTEMVERLRRAGFHEVEVIPVDRGYPHPHLLYAARR